MRICKAVANYLQGLRSDIVYFEGMTKIFVKACEAFLSITPPPNVVGIFRKRKNVLLPKLYFYDGIKSKIDFYIDIEGDAKAPVEITIIGACGTTISKVLHCYGEVNDEERRNARYCHGISENHNLCEKNDIIVRKCQVMFQEAIGSVNIYANGIADIFVFLSEILCLNMENFVLKDLQLPKWDERPLTLSHQMVTFFKRRGLPPIPLNFNCDLRKIHKGFKVNREAKTLCQLSKQLTREHCSLYDTMELFYYHNRVRCNF